MSGIEWGSYLGYFTEIRTRQTPLDREERTWIEEMLAELLGFEGYEGDWGKAGGFGNGTEVVIRLNADPGREPFRRMCRGFPGPIAVRLMRGSKGGRVIALHRRRAETGHPLNGEEHRHFQRSLAGLERGGRFLAIHEWVPGETLEWFRENRWKDRPLRGEFAEEILRQIVTGIVIPAWSAATPETGVLWDIRDANFVISGAGVRVPRDLRVVFVDIGNLRNLTGPRRNRAGQIRSGLGRLKASMKRVLAAQGNWEGRPAGWEKRYGDALEESGLLEELERLPGGAPEDSPGEATVAADRFLHEVRARGLFGD